MKISSRNTIGQMDGSMIDWWWLKWFDTIIHVIWMVTFFVRVKNRVKIESKVSITCHCHRNHHLTHNFFPCLLHTMTVKALLLHSHLARLHVTHQSNSKKPNSFSSRRRRVGVLFSGFSLCVKIYVCMHGQEWADVYSLLK